MNTATATRRSFLGAGGSLVIGFALGGRALAQQGAAPAGPSAPAGGAAVAKSVALDEVDGFLAIGADGKVTLFSGKVDLGTGVRTALSQMAAEELDVPVERITFVQGDTALTPDQGPTYGSLSIQVGGIQIRQAAATARRQLLETAAQRLGVPASELVVEDGTVRRRSGGNGVTYGELIGDRSFSLKVDKDITTKDPANFRIVGQSVPRLDIPEKTTGRFTYMHDFKVDGMLHGRVVRPPALQAELREVDESSVRGIPGFVKLVREGNFLGVIAQSEWGAIRAARELKVTWSDWQGLPEQSRLWEHVRATKVVKDDVTSNVGDAKAALGGGARRLSASYDFAIHTHGSLGPSCAVAEIRDGKLTCWTASQMTHNLRKQIAAMMRMPEEQVRCIYLEGSGCYGRNGHEDAAGDAALLSRAMDGRPVRVQWMREDEHGWDPKGPPTLIDLRAALDAQGNIVAWESEFFIPQGAAGNVALVPAELAGLPHEEAMAPGNIIQNSALPYTVPNIHTVCHRLESTLFKPSWIRTPGRMQNTYANECFLDELAAAAGADPLDFRLRHLKDERGAELLRRLAVLSRWERRPSPQRNASGNIVKGRGVSYVKYELNRTYVGVVAEVEVNRDSGEIRATRFSVVHDCGQVINPDGVRNQVEGNVLHTLSRTLKEELTWDGSMVTSLDWGSYPVITFPEVPVIDIDLLDRPGEKPWGAGEPAAAVIPSAVSNAVFDATGIRLRSIPFTPPRVKAAMRQAT
ncbi:xanthine dehydrogenase family protein molybdopterin-binding subunit [Roseomonas xinghualingensis]|uniref:xanthine dehydrogenase family protein molybdopterin-binding subunit n=1 Tax=Roseomonas xinghualingensis TaxID=2986475 RepID=UPI0021F11D5E|nr:molybdopterin cofactor-binding domain-containing protein [Roseomonas sp. SXEYE001]MCV4206248.1 molybdopterin-dependent oxidoreductase [Roseomonas sp. SXEYE001]